MFELLRDPNFDFMGRRALWVGLSAVLVVASIGVLVARGVRLGIEFRGGTEIQLRFVEPPDVGAVRAALVRGGFGNARVTTLGDPGEGEIYIQVGLRGTEEHAEILQRVLDVLRGEEVVARETTQPDINRLDRAQLAALLATFEGVDGPQADRLAEAILERRREQAVFRGYEDLAGIEGLTAEIRAQLERRTFVGPFALRGQSYIGPAIGRELLTKAMSAIALSLGAMLVYIWARFRFDWGLAAVIALAHDTVVTLGLFSLFDKEMSLPVVAAFLTLIGYSVNDTVVVFDRIRENLRRRGAGEDFPMVINRSINQTLSRTVITSGLTWIVVLALYLLGGEALSAFSFVLVVGILVGTYSSIYIASPILVLWRQWQETRRARRVPAPAAARKVRGS